MFDYLSIIFFCIHLTNKKAVMNSTVAFDESIVYDSTGAILFIIVVLFWYSMGIVCMLGMQIKARDETVEDCARHRAKLLIETLRDQTHTKQILGIHFLINTK
jgi:hypothetical protein